LQKLHEKAIKIDPYLGPEIDTRAPLFFLRQFCSQVVDKIGDDKICGEIFYNVIKRSEWCCTWSDKLRINMGYEKMASIFTKMEWTTEVQDLFYRQFKDANQKNSQFTNFLDFYTYWRERLKGIEYHDRYFIEHFRNNMPTRVQSNVNLHQVHTLKQFHKIIKSIPEDDLAWHDLYMPQSLAKRKEALARMKSKKEGNASAYQQPKREYTQKYYQQMPQVGAVGTTCAIHHAYNEDSNFANSEN